MEYLQKTLQFLKAVLPDAPFFAGATLPQGGVFRQAVCASHEELIKYCWGQNGHGADTYFALSGYSQGWHTVPGKEKAVFRTQENSLAQKALWLDIDVGKDKGPSYPTQNDALTALRAFLQYANLPVPTIVSSGGGVHVYWAMTEQIPTAVWEKLSAHLDALVKAAGLAADPSRTMDAASVLRMPYTYNYKNPAEPRRVEIILSAPMTDTLELGKRIIESVQRHGLKPTPRVSNIKPNASLSLPPELVNNPMFQKNMMQAMEETVVEDRDPVSIAKNCRQFREAGRSAEPVWFAMMSVAKYCRDSSQVVHILSKQDKDRYDEANTAEKFEYVKSLNGGPARCETFAAQNPAGCEGCPYRGKITSPVELGRKLYDIPETIKVDSPVIQTTDDGLSAYIMAPRKDEQLEIEPFTSKRFSVVPGRGIVWHKEEEVSGGDPIIRDNLINPIEIYIPCVHVHYDPVKKEQTRHYVVRRVLNGQSEDLLLPVDAIFGQGTLMKWLGNHGLLPTHPNFFKAQEQFMSAYLTAIQNQVQHVYVKETFGWTTVPGKDEPHQPAFIIGSTVHTQEDEPKPVNLGARCSGMLEREFRKAGTLEGWKQAADMYRVLHQPEGQFGVCAGFAAPLMRFCNGTATNTIINFWEPVGGRGKSTLFHVVNGIWGHPTGMMCSANDTQSGRFQTIAARKNMPICMDEMTMMEERSAAELLYTLANGRDKRKSNQSGTSLMSTGEWETIILMNSNESWYEKMMKYSPTASAPTMRIMDIHWPTADLQGDVRASQYISDTMALLNANYGHAGAVFIEAILKKPGMLEFIPRYIQAFDQKYRVRSDERFWTHGVGAVILGGRIAKAVGLIEYDMDALEQWAVSTMLPRLRGAVTSNKQDPVYALSDFFNDNINKTLVVKSHRRPANAGVNEGLIPDGWVKVFPRGGLDARYELEENVVYVRAAALHRWCRDQNMSVSTLLDALKVAGMYDGDSAAKKSIALAMGVDALDTGRVMCYRFNSSKLKLYKGPNNDSEET